jgi:Leucine-rich repeat (LRR) protein
MVEILSPAPLSVISSSATTGLDLSARSQSMGINGSGLHPALFSLTTLEHLVLDGNHFCGSHLPASGFERLTRLEGLSLRYCNISGPIPPSFAGLHSLMAIHLSYNNFNGEIPVSLCFYLTSLILIFFYSRTLAIIII